MRVNLRGAHVAVPEQLLDGTDVVTIPEQVRGERVPHCVRAGTLRDVGAPHGILRGTLEDGLVQVMAASLTGKAIDVDAGGGKDPLPGPLPARVWILTRERCGQRHPAGAETQVVLVLGPDVLQVACEVRLHRGRKHRHAILVALAAADDDLVGAEVGVLDSQAAALEDAQTCPVEQAGHDARGRGAWALVPRRGRSRERRVQSCAASPSGATITHSSLRRQAGARVYPMRDVDGVWTRLGLD